METSKEINALSSSKKLPSADDFSTLLLYKNFFKNMYSKQNIFDYQKVLNQFLNHFSTLKITEEEKNKICDWHNLIAEQNFLTPFLHLEFEELIFHGHQHVTLKEKHQKTFFQQNTLNQEELQISLEILALKENVSWNITQPFVSFFYQKNAIDFRVTLIHSSTSPNHELRLFLRKSSSSILPLELFANKLSTDNQSHDQVCPIQHLKRMIQEKSNFMIVGGTGSGKTSLLKSLMAEISKAEHIIILEDTHELYAQHFNHTHLLSDLNQKNKSLKDYCAYAMRMSPDRMIIGEMRSGEVIPFTLAMNTGHKGLMSTTHANSALDGIFRLGMLFSLYQENSQIPLETILKMISQSLDYVIYMDNKKIREIVKIQNAEGLKIIHQKIFNL